MRLGLRPGARSQLARAPRLAAGKLADALEILSVVPHSGVMLFELLSGRTWHRKVVRIRRGWSYHILYEVRADEVTVHFIDPSWRQREPSKLR